MINKNVIYAVIIEWPNGGQQLSCFIKKESALKEISDVKNILTANPNNLKVYLSCLNYDYIKNLIIDAELINDRSTRYI